MGMFDEVICRLPLDGIEGQDFDWVWQTKSPFCCGLERWEIKPNGELWHREETRKWKESKDAILGGCSELVASKWTHEKWNGEFEIHHWIQETGWWHEALLWLRDGVVKDVIAKSSDDRSEERI